MEYDLHSKVTGRNALDLQAISSNTTVVGNIIDTKDYESITFFGIAGTITDGVYTLVLEEGDAANLSDAVAIPAANHLGNLFDFVAADDNAIKRTGAISKKRYVRASIVSTGVTTGVNMIGITAVLGHPKSIPTAAQD